MHVTGLSRLYRNRRFPLVAYFLSISSQPSTSVALQQQNSSSFLQSRQISQRSGHPSKINSKMPFSTWNEDHQQHAMTRCVLPLSGDSHKGSSGRVGVLGGSARYTGAPYYAAMAALKAGSDLAFVFCAQEASLPIKCYSPELMVAPVYSATDFDRLVENNKKYTEEAELLINRMVREVTSSMDRLHVLVIGPGLGRCPMVLEATFRIIQEAISRDVPLVLDADALFLLTLDPYHRALENYDNAVLTPNVVERKRLNGFEQNWKGATVVQKGAQDTICRDEKTLVTCAEEGGLKRSGGLGDILAGTIGTLVAWNSVLTNQGKASSSDLPLACWTACCFTKRATKRAYESHLRAMTAPDVLTELGNSINDMTRTSSKL